MEKLRFKDIFTIICTIAAIITSLIIIGTFLTTYQFKYLGQMFNSYFMLQLGIIVTMSLWGIRFYIYRRGKEKYIYSGIFFSIALIFIFFMMNLVK